MKATETKSNAVRFRAVIQQSGKTATGIQVPDECVAALEAGKKPAVNATVNGYLYRNSIASMGGVFMLAVSADVRERAGVKAGDEVEVSLELDTKPREVEVPVDFLDAINADPDAKRFFEGLSYSNKLRHVLGVEGAKAADTRLRRIEKSVGMFREGKV